VDVASVADGAKSKKTMRSQKSLRLGVTFCPYECARGDLNQSQPTLVLPESARLSVN
jgi:hypothetical protein